MTSTMAIFASTFLIVLALVGVDHVAHPCLLNEERKLRSSSPGPDCADDTINMFPFNKSMILSYGRSSCTAAHRASSSSSNSSICKPKCNLLLHLTGCPPASPQDRWKGDLCLTVDRNPAECKQSRFKCTQFKVMDLKRALDVCENNTQMLNKCFNDSLMSSTGRSSAAGKCDNRAKLYSTATGSCLPDVQDATRSADLKNFILPLQNIRFEVNNNDESDNEFIGGDRMSIYARTYATSDEIFEAMIESSLFDPYVILFREFNPCLNKLIYSSRHIVFLHVPEYGTLFEFGPAFSSSNVSKDDHDDQTMTTICTVAADDHRLFISNILMTTGFGLSLGGLLLTIVSVFLTKEHRNIPGINLLCLSFSLIVAYVTVAVVKVARGMEEPCLPEGILHVVAILASLAWMNVMAFDIWHTLSKMYPAAEVSSRKLFRYCAYGWGLPVVVLLAGVLADHLPYVPHRLKPRFSLSQCWFYMGFNTWGTVLFYYGPIGVMMVFNLVLFVLTARILMRSQLDQGQLRDGSRIQRKIKYLFKLYVKLFLVMGLTWVLELTNLFLSVPEFFIFSDFVNTLQGFFIFVIFTCRVHVFKVFTHYCCPKSLSLVSKEDLQKYSRRFSNLPPSATPSRKSSLDPNSCQAIKVAKPQ